jgi:hypothetical protein
MAFPILRDPEVIHLFVDKFPTLLSGPSSAITEFYSFCVKNGVNELSLYDTLSVLPSSTNSVSNFIYSAKTFNYVCEVGGTVNPYDPATLGLKYLNLITTYNNGQPNLSRKYDRITIENEFWNLETSINPLKNTAGFTISTIAGNTVASIAGGIPSSIFVVGNMVKVFGEYRQVLAIGATTITVDRGFTNTVTNQTFEIRDNKVSGAETYAIDFETYLLRLKNIRNVAVANNLKIDAYLSRRVTQVQFLKLIPFIDRILIEADYDQNNYLLYNDPTQLNKIRDVLIRCSQNRTGTVNINVGNNNMQGIGTDFTNELGVGTKIYVSGQVFTIQSIVSSTQATLLETNNSSTINNATFKTYTEFAPIFYINKTLRKTWLTTPVSTKSYADVFKMFTLSGYTVGGSVQSGSNPICYNLEDNPSITGATNLIGISIFDRTEAQSIDIKVAQSSSPRSSCTNPLARSIGANNTYAITFQGNDCTCDNATNGSVTANFSTIQPTPYNYTFTNGGRVIEITNLTTPPPYTFSGLGLGTWNISVRDGNNSVSTGSVTINESFQPTITGNYISAGQGGITVFYTGGYNNYYISRIDNPTNINNQWGPFISYHNAGSDPFFDSNITVNNTTKSYNSSSTPAYNFVPNQSYSFVIGDTDACIKIFTVTIPQASTGPSVNITQTTNPSCDAASNGSITMVAAGTGPYVFHVTYPNGNTSNINSVSTTQVLNNLSAGNYSVTVTDANNVTSTPAVTTTLTNTYNSNINATSTSPNQVCFQLVAGSTYTITSGGGTFQSFNQTVSGPNFTPCFNNLPGGQYNFNVLSSNGCSETIYLTVNSATLTLSLNQYENPSCTQVNDGIINVFATSNGNGQFSYSASNGSVIYSNNSGNFTNLSAGTWTLSVSQNGILGNNIVVQLNNSFYVNVTSTGETVCVSASGGSLGIYTVDINGTLHTYNTASTINCYTGLCSGNVVRVVDGDIINTSISGCVYTTTTPKDCAFNFNVTANTITCGDYGSIIARADGGVTPYIYTATGNGTYTNTTGNFNVLPSGIWTITVEDNIGNSGTTTVNLDSKLKFSADSSALSATCVTIIDGLAPYYILINQILYTASTQGTYCFDLECGYNGIDVYDSCTGTTCANYLFTAPGGIQSFFQNIFWTNCSGMTQSGILNSISPIIGNTFSTCAIFGTPVTTNSKIEISLIGFCPPGTNQDCVVDNSVIVYYDCPGPLSLEQTQDSVNPSCTDSSDGEIYFSGFGGDYPYVSYSAINGNTIYVNGTGTFSNLSAGTWTIYVEDSSNTITSTTVTLVSDFIVDFTITSFTENSVTICANIPIQYQTLEYELTFENQTAILNASNSFCNTFTGITGCSVVNVNLCSLRNYRRLTNIGGGGRSVIKGSDGLFYGVTQIGGLYNYGTIYRYNETTKVYTTLHSFNGTTDGNTPQDIIEVSNGKLYGICLVGGNSGYGTLFSCTTSGSYAVIHNFDGTNGGNPVSNLTLASNGVMYGMTQYDSTYGYGTIFSCSTIGNFGVVYSFQYVFSIPFDGYNPTGKLIEASNGLLYGVTPLGGSSDQGILFNYDYINNQYNNLFSFDYGSVAYPNEIVEGLDNNLYVIGDTFSNKSIYKLDLSGTPKGNVHNFSLSDGSNANKLIKGLNGNLWGSTLYGGLYNFGTIFSCDTLGNFEVLYNFKNSLPNDNFLLNTNSTIFYGTRQSNILYKINVSLPESCCFDTTTNLNDLLKPNIISLYGDYVNGVPSICTTIDISSSVNVWYTVTVNGEENIYDRSLEPNCFSALTEGLTDVSICEYVDSFNYLAIHYFDSTNNTFGTTPNGGLIEASDGNFYGMTFNGGSNDFGVIYSCDTIGNYGIIYNFGSVLFDGKYPLGSLIQGSNGTLYGMTSSDNILNLCGVIFSCTTTGNYGIIHRFDNTVTNGVTKGRTPEGSLCEVSDGFLYGVTRYGGFNNGGVIFKINPTTGQYFSIYEFGQAPNDPLEPIEGVIEVNNKLYGMSYFGGQHNFGTIYELDLNIGVPNTVFSFENVTGSGDIGFYPNGKLTLGSNGLLYGLTTGGGFYGVGAFFEFDPTYLTYRTIHSFSGTPIDGETATGTLFEDENGVFYGLTKEGGPIGRGTIFACDIYDNYKILKTLNNSNGRYPENTYFIKASDNNLYSTVSGGLPNNGGGIIKLTIETLTGCCYSATTNIPQCLDGVTIDTLWIDNMPYVNVLINSQNTTPPYEVTVGGITYPYYVGSLTGNCYPIIGCDPVIVNVCAPEITSQQLSGFTVEHKFSFSDAYDGKNPYGDLTLNYNGIFYGMTSQGGVNEPGYFPTGCGTIFSFDPITKIYQKVYDLDADNGDGFFPKGTLQCDLNYNLYGVNYYDAVSGYGTLFSCTTSGSYAVIHNFDDVNGSNPVTLPSREPLTGRFQRVGTTIKSATGDGVLYSFDNGTHVNDDFSSIGSFGRGTNSYFNDPSISYNKGINSNGPLLVDQELSLIYFGSTQAFVYGMTKEGGTNNNGVIFAYDFFVYGLYDIYNFTGGADGGKPTGGLIKYSYGLYNKVYGMTSEGGAGFGVIFEMDLSIFGSPVNTILHTFAGGTSDGSRPYGSLYEFNGRLYGMTYYGGTNNAGVIFSLDPRLPYPHDYTIIHSFNGSTGGSNPVGSLTMGPDGKLYGMTLYGGNGVGVGGKGIIFSIDFNLTQRAACCYQTTIDVNDPNDINLPLIEGTWFNSQPTISVSIDPNNYYVAPYTVTIDGVTYNYDTNSAKNYFPQLSCGTHTVVITPNAGNNTLDFSGLKSFSGPTIDPGSLFGNPIEPITNEFYALSYAGGALNFGTIFKIDLLGNVEILHNFSGSTYGDGNHPIQDLILSSNGKMYGTTSEGGIYNAGTIFSCDTLGNYGIVYNFSGGTNGGGPIQNLTEVSNGIFYGLVYQTGAFGMGIIFSCDTIGNYKLIHSFSGSPYDGMQPLESFYKHSNGILYGTTFNGGTYNAGTIFSCDTLGNYGIIHSFNNTVIPNNGCNPRCTLIEGDNGILYGTTSNGGNIGSYGTIFTCSTSGNYGVIHKFTGVDGDGPQEGLFKGQSNIFYGTTYGGGIHNLGTIYSCDTLGNHGVIYNFNGSGSTGSLPYNGLYVAENDILYGFTQYGGIYSAGNFYRFNPYNFLYGDCPYSGTVNIPCFYLDELNVEVPCTTNDGQISVQALGGNPDYTYTLTYTSITNDTYSITQFGTTFQPITFINLSALTWGLIVTDSSGQTLSQIYDFNPIDNPSITTVNGDTICISLDQVGLSLTGITLDGNILYSGNIGLTNFCFTAGCGNHLAQFYTTNGCMYPIPFSFDCPPSNLVFTNLSQIDPFCCNSSAKINVAVTGGTLPYTYTIYNIPTTATYTNTTGNFTNIYPPTGTWQVIATDANGSTISSNIFTLNSIFFADITFINNIAVINFSGSTGIDVLINGVSQTLGYIATKVSGGTLSYPIPCGTNINVEVIGRIVINPITKTYEYCPISASTFYPCPLFCSNIISQPRCPGQNANSVTVLVTGGTPNYNITLTNGTLIYTANTSLNSYIFNDNPPLVTLIQDDWTITVIDSDGTVCIQDITIQSSFDATITGTSTGACFTVVGGNPPYTLYIDGVIYTPLINQISNDIVYCVPLNCGNHQLEIRETGVPPAACSIVLDYFSSCQLTCSTITTDPGCNDNCSGSVTISVTGGTPPYNYSLIRTSPSFYQTTYTGPQTTWTFYDLCEGTYDITVSALTNGAFCTSNLNLASIYDVVVSGYAVSTNCLYGVMCIDITGGTPPYDVYIDGILRATAITQTHSCYSATCGVNHTYQVIDSAPPCNIPLNQALLKNTSFTGTSDWILTNDYTGSTIISGGSAIVSSTTYNTLQVFRFLQDYIFPFQKPISIKYNVSVSTGTIQNYNYLPQFRIQSPFGSTNMGGIAPNSTYSTTKQIVSTVEPVIFSGFGINFYQSFLPNNKTEVKDMQLTLLSYTVDCRCSASGTTYVPCNPPLTLNVVSYTEPNCFSACNGTIIVSATGGVLPYSYSATNGTSIYISPNGVFNDLCEDTWDLSVSDSCNTVVTNAGFFLPNSFHVTVDTYPTEFCVGITGGTPPYHVFIDNVEIDTISQSPVNICYSASCGVTTIIRVVDSST